MGDSLELALTFFYFWVNYGPLSRGTAACGLVILNALLIATGYIIISPIPGMQIDWEAILVSSHADFIANVRSKIEVEPLRRDHLDVSFSKIPFVSDHITTLREMIHVLNVKD